MTESLKNGKTAHFHGLVRLANLLTPQIYQQKKHIIYLNPSRYQKADPNIYREMQRILNRQNNLKNKTGALTPMDFET